ncbi:hypothetical protein BSZ35_06780 [Salinibacter sp. 10B]|uniref:hypothetical protein n=1 Tax=Salinibacter sp. 10B TaxID=1923971 RepID=UPI000CF4B60C|nr:hypothetical protein [Salinibacter sp. 10B]PQJ34344.1 hypothetical protein BSZ35_06780 [Salinibacter sp. 10B]
MWTVVLFAGLALLILGIVKRDEQWGKAGALIGGIGIAVSLFVAGPDMLDDFQRGFQEGYAAAQQEVSQSE